jgi:hypothetical protein
MYFKGFPQYLYDFNYGNRVKTSVVVDITRNIRFRKEILQNITLFDEYDIIDGETPEIISEKFYGTPEYHWVVMLANGKYDYRFDFPMIEPVLQRHIEDVYNPTLYSSDWYWTTREGIRYFYIKITSVQVPFDGDYLTAPVKITIRDDDSSFVHVIDFPKDPVILDSTTQYFYFPINGEASDQWYINHGKEGATKEQGVGNAQLIIETEGREHNPVYYVNQLGNIVNPSAVNAIPVTGDVLQRLNNDAKRKIKIISPSLLETILRNYEDEL